jgi:DNA-binding response OmpR family regulator
MCAFFDRPGRILTRTALTEAIGGLDGANDRFIDTQVSRLRRTLNAHFEVDLIRTVRGSGYICDPGR